MITRDGDVGGEQDVHQRMRGSGTRITSTLAMIADRQDQVFDAANFIIVPLARGAARRPADEKFLGEKGPIARRRGRDSIQTRSAESRSFSGGAIAATCLLILLH